MREVFEKIIDEIKNIMKRPCDEENCQFEESCCKNIAFMKAIEIVKHESEDFNNGWIPCNSGKLPKENEYVRVTIWSGHEWIGCYIDGKWFVYGAAGLIEATVLAWKTTESYQPKGE